MPINAQRTFYHHISVYFAVIKTNFGNSNLQNHLKNLIQRVVGIRNEVKTAHDNITMLKVKIEAVQTDINNFHLKNLKDIKSQGEFIDRQTDNCYNDNNRYYNLEKKTKAELKRLRANRNRLHELKADAKSNNVVKFIEQSVCTRSQTNSDIVLHLR